MACKGCKGDTIDTWYGEWCQVCGGTAVRPGVLIYRHVATVDGKGGRLAIVWDESTQDYAFIYPRKINPHAGSHDLDGEFRLTKLCTAHGSLDAMLALAQPEAKGDGDEFPSLSASPFSTVAERKMMGI